MVPEFGNVRQFGQGSILHSPTRPRAHTWEQLTTSELSNYLCFEKSSKTSWQRGAGLVESEDRPRSVLHASGRENSQNHNSP